MADQADVEQTLATLIAGALYPAGPQAASAIGAVARVYRGWPVAHALDRDLAEGIVNVSVFAVPDSLRVTTRWPIECATRPGIVTLFASVAGDSATFTGVAGVGQVAGVLAAGAAYVHRGLAGDTPAMVAAVLASAIRPVRPASASGATLTVPGAGGLVARAVADGSALVELRRQEQRFRVTVWSPDPGLRDVSASSIDAGFAGTDFIALPDGSFGRIRLAGGASSDGAEDARLYRRDLVYAVEYPTTSSPAAPAMLFGDLVLNGNTIFA